MFLYIYIIYYLFLFNNKYKISAWNRKDIYCNVYILQVIFKVIGKAIILFNYLDKAIILLNNNTVLFPLVFN